VNSGVEGKYLHKLLKFATVNTNTICTCMHRSWQTGAVFKEASSYVCLLPCRAVAMRCEVLQLQRRRKTFEVGGHAAEVSGIEA